MVRALVTLATMAGMANLALAQITFNVINFPAGTNVMGVKIDGQIHKMATNATMHPLWSVHMPSATNGTQYHYLEMNQAGTTVVKEETFVRTANVTAKRMATEHEFFERPLTKYEVPRLPYTYMPTYPSNSKAFKENQIATFHLVAPEADIKRMMENPKVEHITKVTLKFINAKTFHVQNNITFKTAGKSSKDFDKQSFKLEFEDELFQEFFDRPNIKLRALRTSEPSMMREKLYIDMLNSVGIPTQQGSYVRLFINNKPYGLYLMVDDIKRSFLKQTVHNGQDVGRGSLIQMNAYRTEADLVYRGDDPAVYLNNTVYTSQYLGNNPPENPLKEIIAFIKDLDAFDPATTPDHIGYFNNTRLELDGYLRCMALEYLFGAFDNYWKHASNYFMYKNPTLAMGGKWQWIPTDFDGLMGVGGDMSPADGPYQTFYDFAKPRPLVQKLILQSNEIRPLFEETLKNIVSTAFKPAAMGPHIDGIHNMIAQDAEWDFALPPQSPGKNYGYTIEDFKANPNTPSPKFQVAIKPWIQTRATAVSTALNFQIPEGTADRVVPPPRSKKDDPYYDDEDPNAGGDGNGPNSAPSLKQASGLVTVLAVLASAVLLA